MDKKCLNYLWIVYDPTQTWKFISNYLFGSIQGLIDCPPSITIARPVRYFASSDARKTARFATSSRAATLPNGLFSVIFSRNSLVYILVRTAAGAIAFTFILYGAASRAKHFMNSYTPPFDAQ